MPSLTIVTRDGTERDVEARAGWSVMENIRDNGFDELLALCGGCCSCATCHVHVDPDWFGRLDAAQAPTRTICSTPPTTRSRPAASPARSCSARSWTASGSGSRRRIERVPNGTVTFAQGRAGIRTVLGKVTVP